MSIPYFFEVRFDLKHVSGQIFPLQNLIVLIKIDYSAEVQFNFLSFVSQSCRQLSQRARREHFSFLQKGGNFFLLALAAPTTNNIDQINPHILPLLPNSCSSVTNKFCSFLPDPLLTLHHCLPHILQKVTRGHSNRFMIIVICEDLQLFLFGVVHMIPELYLFDHRPSRLYDALAVDLLLAVIDSFLHIHLLSYFECVVGRDIVILTEMPLSILLFQRGQVQYLLLDHSGFRI